MDTVDQIVMSSADKARYADAVNKLLATWPEERIAKFAQQLKDKTSSVDLTKPIAFDTQRGLYNIRPSNK